MIEVSRYILAFVVTLTHLQPLGVGRPGSIAVFAFYTLSGYQNFFPLIRFPKTLPDIVSNIAVLGQVTLDFVQWQPLAKPVVTSWSLSIEVFCYVLLAVYFARTPARLWAFVAIGAIAMGFSTWHCAVSADPSLYGPYCYQNRYGVLQAGFIPFAMGGLFYFHSRSLRGWINANLGALIVLLVAAIAATFLGNAISATVGPYLGIGVMFCLLSVWNGQSGNSTQDFFGRASYHLFIGHMPIAAVLVTGLNLRQGSVFVFLAAVIAALALSLGLVPLERNINVMRQRIAKMSKPYGEEPTQGHDPSEHQPAATREDAMAAFAKSWRRE
jgi:peptidoglycan/LPS O-acetylase OafA/YrhL